MRAHWAAALFPMLSLDELGELARDIKAHGLREPIELLDGEIVDGRNRHTACELAAVSPRFADAPAYARQDVVAYVISKNLRRRHLDESQRAMVAAKLREAWKTRAPLPQLGETAEAAASLLNVGRGSVERAGKVLRDAAPELVAAVERGDIAVSTASVLSAAPVERQREVADAPKSAPAAAAEVKAQRMPVVGGDEHTIRQIVRGLRALSMSQLVRLRDELNRLIEKAA
jgi:ParB-like chromosome segregation protein Spo0J